MKGFKIFSNQPYNFVKDDKKHDKERIKKSYIELLNKNIKKNNRTNNLFGGCVSCNKSSSLVGGCESCGHQAPDLYYYLGKS